MNYIGSKYSLLTFLDSSISSVVKRKTNRVFCDLFSGTGIVGAYFKQKGYSVIANDIQYYGYVLSRHYIATHRPLSFRGLKSVVPGCPRHIDERTAWICRYLTSIKGQAGYIYKNYCLGGTKTDEFPRQYFSDANGKKCDAIRSTIESWRKQRVVTGDEYYFLLTSLLESIDKYANTASVYGAFLKHLKKSAQRELELAPAEVYLNKKKHIVYNEDINQLIRKVKGDILYLDPPYNHRQYATNYHLLETIARYDKPRIKGKTGLRNYEKEKSLYCSRAYVLKVFEDLIMNANMKYIFLSYNNEGLMSAADIKHIMRKRGAYGVFTRRHNRFKADRDINRSFKADATVEYLHYVTCA